jgi:molybdopterin molybdotransferase
MSRALLPLEQAIDRLLTSARPTAPERVELGRAAGRVLAEDVRTPFDLPPFDYSAMDGYALASSDASGGAKLPVVGESAAGSAPSRLTAASAMRIFTGAPMPDGADAVVMQEDTEREGDLVTLARPPRPGANVRRRGEDLREGALALGAGTRLSPGHVALLAALDRPTLLVHRRPQVTVLCSGDELRLPGSPGRAGSIAESNGPLLEAMAREAGADVRLAPFVPDELEAARRAVAASLEATDVLLTVGGVSVGDYDVMKRAFELEGVTLDFWRVALKPGKPLAVGRTSTSHVLGLPGNPAAAALTMLLFGAPLLRALSGERDVRPRPFRVTVRGSHRKAPGRAELLRARLVVEAGELLAELAASQTSGAVTSFAGADALVWLDAESEGIADGETAPALRIRDMLSS